MDQDFKDIMNVFKELREKMILMSHEKKILTEKVFYLILKTL